MSKNKQHPNLLNWQLTPWAMNGNGGWKQQPVILVEGRVPFFADHPNAYIAKLQELHDDPTLARGSFFTCIGQFRDGLEQGWNSNLEKETITWPAKH